MSDARRGATSQPELRVSYLCLEQSVEGSAANAHIRGFFDGWPGKSLQVTRARHASTDGIGTKISSLASAFLRYLRTLPRARVAGARAHPAVFPALLVAKLMGRKAFLFLQGRPDDLPSGSLPYRILGRVSMLSFKGAMKCSDVVFATSAGLAEWASEVTDAQVFEVTNGVDVSRFPWPVQDRAGVVFVGTPAPWQGLDCLLEAADSEHWPDGVELTVIGVGPEGRPADPSGRVHFKGRMSPVEVAQELSRHQIGVSPKRLDQATVMGVSPFKLSEYHGAGLAVVASDVPGQHELVTRSAGGVLFPPDDARALALAVAQLVDNPPELAEYQARAREFAQVHLSWVAQRASLRGALGAVVKE